MTDVFVAYDATEQRVRLRHVPRTLLTFKLLAAEPREAAAIESFIFGEQGDLVGVPFWPDMQSLAADAAISDTNVQVDTSYRKFVAGGLVLLWRSMFDYEFAEIVTVNADSLDLASGLTKAWDADGGGTFVIPLLRGRMSNSIPLKYLNCSVTDLTISFQCEEPEAGEGTPGAGTGPLDVAELHECAV